MAEIAMYQVCCQHSFALEFSLLLTDANG